MSAPPYASAYSQPVAEPGTRAYLNALYGSGAPPMETLSPAAARDLLAEAQRSVELELPPAEVSEKTIETSTGPVQIFVVRPQNAQATLPAFMFFHGGGWVLGDFPIHERMVRDLVAYSGAAAVFVEYDRSPEAQYPVAFNQCYAATSWVAEQGSAIGVDGTRLSVAGNSVGGNMAAVVALKALHEGGPTLRHQMLFWPVTDARFDTPSYDQFEEGYALTRGMMRWFWDAYIPAADQRDDIYASPLRATAEQLRGLPATVVQTAELDVLRDEGEAYARKLAAAGVPVTSLRAGGMIHDYGLLNPLSGIPAVQAALRQAALEIKRHLA